MDYITYIGGTLTACVLIAGALAIAYMAGKVDMRTEIRNYGCDKAMSIYKP